MNPITNKTTISIHIYIVIPNFEKQKIGVGVRKNSEIPTRNIEFF